MPTSDYCVSYGTYYSYLKRSTPKLLNSHPVPEVSVDIKRFSDNEISVKFGESLRGKHLFVFGETTQHLTELIMTLDAAKRCSVDEITVVLPYYGYSRQDKREGTRGCIGAKAVAHVIASMGIDRVVSIDLHAAQIQGYFQGPFEHLSGLNIFSSAIVNTLNDPALDPFFWDNVIFATPDAGGTSRALKFANHFNKSIVTINKRRDTPGVVTSMELTGDVQGKYVIIIDDMGDSCGTISKASDLLLISGAVKIFALVTHPVLTGDWINNIEKSSLSKLLLSDTLNVRAKLAQSEPDNRYNAAVGAMHAWEAVTNKIQIISCIDLLEEAIDKIAHDRSISHLN